jgi:hypothetical protein
VGSGIDNARGRDDRRGGASQEGAQIELARKPCAGVGVQNGCAGHHARHDRRGPQPDDSVAAATHDARFDDA